MAIKFTNTIVAYLRNHPVWLSPRDSPEHMKKTSQFYWFRGIHISGEWRNLL